VKEVAEIIGGGDFQQLDGMNIIKPHRMHSMRISPTTTDGVAWPVCLLVTISAKRMNRRDAISGVDLCWSEEATVRWGPGSAT